MKIKNMLLDRDGTVIEEKNYLSDPLKVNLLPGVGTALKQIVSYGIDLFLVSNQSGLGRGLISWKEFQKVQKRLHELLCKYEVQITDEIYCPHIPEKSCFCRKPSPGMWYSLAEKNGLIPTESIMIGDQVSDIQFGKNAGLKSSILVLTGHGQDAARQLGLPELKTYWKDFDGHGLFKFPHVLAQDLPAACQWVLNYNSKGSL